MSAEAQARQAIQSLIDKSDLALSQGNIDVMFADVSSNYAEDATGKTIDIAAANEMWIKAQQFMDTISTSEITAFVVTDNKAIVFFTSHHLTRLKFPKWCSRISIITDEQYRSEWVKTSDSWLCMTSAHLKTHLRSIKWKKAAEQIGSEPGHPAT
jgi:hypothetical protein